MAKINSISNNPFDMILKRFDSEPSQSLPIWNEGQKMFITDEYESAAGHRYYSGIRFCERLAIVERVGNYHTWTYIDGIEIYSFDGKERKLMGTRKYDKTFYNKEFIKKETKEMVEEVIKAQSKLGKIQVTEESVKDFADKIVEQSYTSLLDDNFYSLIQHMLPVLVPQKLLS